MENEFPLMIRHIFEINYFLQYFFNRGMPNITTLALMELNFLVFSISKTQLVKNLEMTTSI